MPKISKSDRAASARILRLGDPDAHMYYGGEGDKYLPMMTGAEQCPHPLSGSGEMLVEGNPNVNAAVIEEWRGHPYYHHNFTVNPRVRSGGHERCFCDNGRGGKVHVACWESDSVIIGRRGVVVVDGHIMQPWPEGIATPQDEVEAAMRAINMVNAKLISPRAAVTFAGMPLDEWNAYGIIATCDDCGRSDGTHDPAVEH